MKKLMLLLIILLVVFLNGCRGKIEKITDVDAFDSLFTDAIKYDIRDDSLCEEGHIKGFLCVGSKDNDTLIENISIIAKNKKVNIVLIGNEEDVLYILDGLSKKGFKNLYYFEDGYEGYVNAKGESFEPEIGCGC